MSKLLSFPAAAAERLEAVAMRLAAPNQIVLQSPWTQNRQILDRGFPSWEGEAVISRCDMARADGRAAADAIEQFMASLQGVANRFALAHQRSTLAAQNPAVTVTGQQLVAGELVTQFAPALTGGPFAVLQIDDRMFSVRRRTGTGQMVLDPQRPVRAGAQIRPAPTLTVTARDVTPPSSNRTLDWAGPWTLQWREWTSG